MLQKLFIQNYAIIDEISISFDKHLNIITGETGAGKSILMGALNLILGQRADTGVLQQKDRKCIVEGGFAIAHQPQFKQFFKQHELDAGDEILLRREIAPSGKSRSFINDTPVSLAQLKELAVMLVDLHQQFDTLELGNASFQREVIDALASNAALLQEMDQQYSAYISTKKQLEALLQQQADANRELDYNKFLFDELDELSLKENELEQLDAELNILSNAETIKQQLQQVYMQLDGGDQPIVQQLKTLYHSLQAIHGMEANLPGLAERLNSALIELQDVAGELERIDEKIHYDAERIEEVNQRMAHGYRLLKKHNVTTTSALLLIQESLQQKLDVVLNMGNSIEQLRQDSSRLKSKAEATALQLHERRSAQLKDFAEKVNKLLAQVGMPNARLQVTLQPAALNAFGSDEIVFLFDANKSNRFEPLHKVASGGELSRLMLSVKSLVAKKLQLPTLIFDEIDTGISGEAARQVGIIMKDLSAAHQVISITHQPQIAAKASAHFFVHKAIAKDKIVTSLRRLSDDERITAIAQMLSGEKPTAAALENAREMVRN